MSEPTLIQDIRREWAADIRGAIQVPSGIDDAAMAVKELLSYIEQLQAREARLSGLLKRVSDAHWHEHSYGEIRPLVREIDCALSYQEPGKGGGE